VTAEADFDVFYRTTRHRVVTTLYALTGDLGEAQDAAQEAYARAWQRWSRLAGYEDPEAWVRVVGRRICLSAWRKARNGLKAYRQHGTAPPTAPPGDDTVALIGALRRLPADQRVAITLHHLMDMSVTDVARETGTSVNTVKSRLVRGRRTLSGLLGEAITEEVRHA
jgi:RNA polymerase sigma-70 factor (sigma-E family)